MNIPDGIKSIIIAFGAIAWTIALSVGVGYLVEHYELVL